MTPAKPAPHQFKNKKTVIAKTQYFHNKICVPVMRMSELYSSHKNHEFIQFVNNKQYKQYRLYLQCR